MNHAELARLTTGEICPKYQKLLKRGPREKTITAANLMIAIRAGLIPPCPRCGRAGFIEDEFMVIIGVCPECSGAGHALKSKRIAAESADETPDGQAENACRVATADGNQSNQTDRNDT